MQGAAAEGGGLASGLRERTRHSSPGPLLRRVPRGTQPIQPRISTSKHLLVGRVFDSHQGAMSLGGPGYLETTTVAEAKFGQWGKHFRR